ncbi:MAG: phytoene/squalene synthase family protein [Ignavibacteriaceae bacterium]|nr:phytoene/squalene synthase family protein [Ignavibacteriaceae bacterium]
MDLYNKIAVKTSKYVTKSYSTSFSLGILVFASAYKDAIYSIYGFVRLADEIVDTFHKYDRKKMFSEFREETEKALSEGISTNLILHAFQKVVNDYKIDKAYIDAFLDSMEMDLHNNYYERDHYNRYIYGSAEVVGLMCLKVFCEKDEKLFNELIGPAKSLGSAFQKVNFLRDVKSDMEERGRIYLPSVKERILMNDENKAKLEAEIESEFADAFKGIKKLPAGVKFGVYSAYLYYQMLFRKIRNLRIEELMKRRVRISNFAKLILMIKSLIEVKFLRIT